MGAVRLRRPHARTEGVHGIEHVLLGGSLATSSDGEVVGLRRDEADELGHTLLHEHFGVSRDLRILGDLDRHHAGNIGQGQEAVLLAKGLGRTRSGWRSHRASSTSNIKCCARGKVAQTVGCGMWGCHRGVQVRGHRRDVGYGMRNPGGSGLGAVDVHELSCRQGYSFGAAWAALLLRWAALLLRGPGLIK